MPKTKKSKKKPFRTKILIVAKQNKAGLKHAKKLANILGNYTDHVTYDRSSAIRFRHAGTSIKKFDGDLIITIGGDGTFLWTAHQTSVPILPIKIEGHGFLCTTNFKEVEQNIKTILKKEYQIVEKMRLKCTRVRTGGLFDKLLYKYYPMAINEIAFSRKRPSKILELEFTIDGVQFRLRGDGIIFSTPSGSTAYNASAGGPIVESGMELISIVPLVQFFSNLKPMIVPADKKIEVEIKSDDCALIIDGHGGDYIKSGTKFVIDAGKHIKVAMLSEQNFYKNFKEEFLG
jgi:NAD+ kinase